MTDTKKYTSSSLDDSSQIARKIASELSFPMCVFFEGDLGSGKTTLIKSIIEYFGYDGTVTSPTYNLIQEYPCQLGTIYHMDLYRVNDPFELEFLALNDLWSDTSLFLIEWPNKGDGFLPTADFVVDISKTNSGRLIKFCKD